MQWHAHDGIKVTSLGLRDASLGKQCLLLTYEEDMSSGSRPHENKLDLAIHQYSNTSTVM